MDTKRLGATLAALIAAPLLALLPTPAQADAPTEVRVQVDGNPWGIRQAVRAYDRGMPSMRATFGPCRPGVMCITVDRRNYGPTRFYGMTRCSADGQACRIELNTYYRTARDGYRRAYLRHTACHEVGHALGLAHHRRPLGCMSTGGADRLPRSWETRALAARWAR